MVNTHSKGSWTYETAWSQPDRGPIDRVVLTNH